MVRSSILFSRDGSLTARAVTHLADLAAEWPRQHEVLGFSRNIRVFEPRLFEPKSLFPGKGIWRAETKGRNGLEGSRAQWQRRGPREEPRQFSASCREPGNLFESRNAWWCTQSKANPSLPLDSLLTGKNTGKIHIGTPGRPGCDRDSPSISALLRPFREIRNREFDKRKQGRWAQDQAPAMSFDSRRGARLSLQNLSLFPIVPILR